MSYMDKVMQSESAKNWVMIPGKNDEETLYFCKATGQLFDKNGVSSNKQFPTADSDAESEDESERGPEGAFGHFLRQFFIPNWKPKPQSWTELATLYASKQLPGSWESDSEEETEPIESQQITKPKQITADIVSSSPANGPSL